MENEEKLLGLVGTVSERAGVLTSKVVGIGGKIAGFASNSISAGKEMIGLTDDKTKRKGQKKSDVSKKTKIKSEPAPDRQKPKPAKEEEKQSRLESRLKELKAENKSLMSGLEQIRKELSETKSREGTVRARAAALESELDDTRQQLEQVQKEAVKAKTADQERIDDSVAKLESELEAAQRKLEKTRGQAKEIQNRLKSQLKDMQAEKESLRSELEISHKDSEEIETREKILTEEINALETSLAATRKELGEMRNQTEKTHAELASQIRDLQQEKESLLSELSGAKKGSREITKGEDVLAEQVAVFESELSATQRELSKTRSQAEKKHSELLSQLKDLQTERESLISDLEDARNKIDDERFRAHSMEAQIASLKGEVATLHIEQEKILEKKPDMDIDFARDKAGIEAVPTEQISKSAIEADGAKPDEQMTAGAKEQPSTPLVSGDQVSTPAYSGPPLTDYREKLPVPTVEEIRPSVEADAAYEESVIGNVENVEEKAEPDIEPEADIEDEEKEPERVPEIEAAELLKVTAEEVQTAVFKSENDKLLFTKAFSDFASLEANSRANAAGIIAGIRHELSLRLLITHMADEPSAMVRQKCIEDISKLGMKEGISAIECALDDKVAPVRLAAVWALYRLAGVESIPKLVSMLYDGDVAVRRRAITCIGWVGGQITRAGVHHRPRVISALIRCLNDPVESVRNAALNSLQSVTGKKMPAGRTSPERLIGQWQKWWKTELSG
jgi:predicted  nucleic acid-binding Zn-ribbon protein